MTTRIALLLTVLLAVLLTVLAGLLVPRPASADTDPVGVWPLVPAPDVMADFDPPADPWGAGHRGVDLLGSPGQPVRAALPGTVTWAGVLAGRGVVVVSHGDTRTTYEPVDATVTVGTSVGAGDRIGRLSPTGSHCLPRSCLHWGWIRGETYLDPLRLVGAGPVRLLPLWRAEPIAARVTAMPYAGWRAPIQDLHDRSCGSEVLAQMHVCGPRGRDAVPPEDLAIAVPLVEPRRLEGE
ncbi:M23 family metallopeptidase [Nocardioides sp. SR21]|uniref:M23 family metallopeptidase n=1 Tax=Nocardioides sp. SR21 TaxID=2919501 RepID=UPI001FA9D722|nr:M23 family metallopeptidase [Nocardioides sp. SR21]